jgi:hypothetical protein
MIYVTSTHWTNTEDRFREGEVGRPFDIHIEAKGLFNSLDQLSQYLNGHYGVPLFSEEPDSWAVYGDENGRIDIQFHVNADNDAPSKRELSEWKKGKLKLWSAYVTLDVMIGNMRSPSPEELASETGLQIV